MVYTLRFFLFKTQLFHDSNVFGSCVIHMLYTECPKKIEPFFFIFFLGAQCVESGVSCTDWIFEKGTFFFGHLYRVC